MKKWGRVARMGIFSMLLILLGVDISAAWLYIGVLTYPPCIPPQPFPDNFPEPEKIELQSDDGIMVPAWYFPSRNGAAVITLGGMGGSLGVTLPPAGMLIEAGYGVLQIGSRACASPVQPVTLGAEEVNDAAAGLAYLSSRREVDADRIGVFGFSMGGVGAIRTAARKPEIAAVLAEGGYFNLGEDIVEPGTDKSLPREVFLNTIAGMYWVRTGVNPWQISPVDDIALISPRPILLVYGEFEAVSGRAQLQFNAAGQPKELWVVPGGDHGTNFYVAQEEYADRALSFFDEALGHH